MNEPLAVVGAGTTGAHRRHEIAVFLSRYALWFCVVVLCAVLAVANSRFIALSNVINVLRQASINLILSVGMTCVILTGGIDLSVGSVLALAGCVTCLTMRAAGMVLGIAAGLVVGAACGLVNGLLVARVRIPAFIATLGMLTMARGFALVSTGGEFVTGLPASYVSIGDGFVFGRIPIPVVIAAVTVVVAHFLLSQTKFGLQVYAVGGNFEATRLSGVNNARIMMVVYTLSGFLAAVAGIVLTARVASAQPTFGEGYNLNAVASVIIGGTSLRGGEGNVLRTVLGALMIAILSNGLNILNVDYFWQQVVIGAVIILAVIMDRFR